MVIDRTSSSLPLPVASGARHFGRKVVVTALAALTVASGATVLAPIATADTVIATIPVKANPQGAVIAPNGNRAYVTNRNGNSVSVIDTASNTITNTITGLSSPSAVAITPNGNRAYVTNNADNSVSVISIDTPAVAPSISGTAPAGVVGDSYLFTPTVSGTPTPTVAVTSGTLPAGLTLDPGTGQITGTPTTAGTFLFTVTATNTAGTADLPLTIVVDGGGCSGSLCSGSVGSLFGS